MGRILAKPRFQAGPNTASNVACPLVNGAKINYSLRLQCIFIRQKLLDFLLFPLILS